MMAEIKDKIVTVESLSELHGYNKEVYMTKSNPIGTGSLSLNRKENTTVGEYSVAEGYNCTASGYASHAENNSTASGNYSHAEGHTTTASAQSSHAEGDYTKASGMYSHAEGYATEATESCAHAEGNDSVASGLFSHAEGTVTEASGMASHAEGNGTIAQGDCQHVEGKFNIKDNANKYAHIVGNGSSTNSRSNAYTLDWHGNAWFAGNIKADGNMILSANQFGDELPNAGTVGRIFFKKVSE